MGEILALGSASYLAGSFRLLRGRAPACRYGPANQARTIDMPKGPQGQWFSDFRKGAALSLAAVGFDLLVVLPDRGAIAHAAQDFMFDIADRLANRVQLTTDGHGAYLSAVVGAFGIDWITPLWDWVSVSAWMHKHDQVSAEVVLEARMVREENRLATTQDKISARELTERLKHEGAVA